MLVKESAERGAMLEAPTQKPGEEDQPPRPSKPLGEKRKMEEEEEEQANKQEGSEKQ